MKNFTLNTTTEPETRDPLTELLHQGAKELIERAVRVELANMLAQYDDLRLLEAVLKPFISTSQALFLTWQRE